MSSNSTSVNLSTSAFLSELMNLAIDIVWKDQSLANQYETPDLQVNEEIFVSAKKGVLTYDTIFQLDADTLSTIGYTQDQIDAAMDDKYYVDPSLRDSVLNKYVSNLTSYDSNTGHYTKYDEQNNYYRMLNGLPDLDDTDFIYQTKYEDISTTTPIHLLPLVDRYKMENDGYFTELLTEYPTKKYIKYLASKQIDPYDARIADRFAILWMNTSEYTNLYNDFRDIYTNCRNNVIRVYYNDAMAKNNSSYEGFMAMVVLFMTIELMHYKYLDADITRDFYDLDSIKYIYNSYNVPFYSSIPIEYHKKIVKNMNRLLGYKGSTRVFFELFNVFNYTDIKIYEYYLLRTRKFENGKPVFAYKEDGTPDNSQIYTIKFGKVKLYDDPPMELSDPANHIEYADMTSTDPYWINDADLQTKLYDEDFNYLETKYVGIQTVFDLYKILFESCYFFKMLLDNRSALNATSIYYNNVNANVNLFDLTIYLCALISRKYGYTGNIPTDIPSVAKVLGYDFTKSLSTIRSAIMNDVNLKTDTVLLNIFTTMDVNSLTSVNNTYAKIVSIRDHCVEVMSNLKSRSAWFAYYQLYNSIMTSKVLQSTYKKQDGTTALTFADLLSDLNIDLYVRETMDDLDIDTELNDVLILYKKSFSNLEYVEYVDGIDISSLIEHLFKILEFFKSAKSELTGYNIVYTIAQRGVNFFKMIDALHSGTFSDRDTDASNSRFEYLLDILRSPIFKDRVRSNVTYLRDSFDRVLQLKAIAEDQFNYLNDELLSRDILEVYHMTRDNSDKEILNDVLLKNTLKYKIEKNYTFTDVLRDNQGNIIV